MAILTPSKALTFEDFCVLVTDGQKADLIDGVIYMASPDNTDANELFTWLITIIYPFTRKRKLGRTFGSRVAFRINEINAPEPDIGVVLTSRLHLVQRGRVNGPPDLAIEIVSPDSIERDYVRKRAQYQRAGVTEYWIIDEMEQTVLVLFLGKSGRYREIRPRQGVLHSKVLPGFWLRPEWLWQQPLPDPLAILQDLLGQS